MQLCKVSSSFAFCVASSLFDPVIWEIYNEIVDMVPEQWDTIPGRKGHSTKKKLKEKQDCNKRNFKH